MLLIPLQKCIICMYRKRLAEMSPLSFYVLLYIMVVRISVLDKKENVPYRSRVHLDLLLCSVEVYFKYAIHNYLL